MIIVFIERDVDFVPYHLNWKSLEDDLYKQSLITVGVTCFREDISFQDRRETSQFIETFFFFLNLETPTELRFSQNWTNFIMYNPLALPHVV